MSLVCHTIVSRYTPQQRDPVNSTGPEADSWQTESSFGLTERLHSRPAPSFVPASLQYDEYGMPKVADMVRPQLDKSYDSSQDVSAWYRSLTARGSVNLEKQPSVHCPPVPASIPHSSHRSPVSVPHSLISDSPSQRRDWFASCPSRVTATNGSKSSTLADLLSRNPPPRPCEPTFRPPVFLTIGPSNRGFAMLERKGWQEGEGLGSARVERNAKEGLGFSSGLETVFLEHDTEQHKPIATRSDTDVKPLLNNLKPEVIDLTLSDSESEDNSTQDLPLSDSNLHYPDSARLFDDTSSHRTTLLIPIATTLKADRLGIGLKAARHSRGIRKKAVTHTSAALAAHIRHGNQAREDRARHGRGGRGFARAKRKEERDREYLLAYMNSN